MPSPPEAPPAYTHRLLLSGGIAVLLAAAAGAAVVVCLGVQGLLLARGRPVDGLLWLAVPAVPLLAAGQLVTVLQARARAGGGRVTSPRAFVPALFGSLPGPLVALFVGLFYLALVSGLPQLVEDRTPTGPGTWDCPYPGVVDRSHVACVSESGHAAAGVARQAVGASVGMAFFSLHTGAALGIVADHRRRKPRGTPPLPVEQRLPSGY